MIQIIIADDGETFKVFETTADGQDPRDVTKDGWQLHHVVLDLGGDTAFSGFHLGLPVPKVVEELPRLDEPAPLTIPTL